MMDDLITEFIAETAESLDNIDKELIELENDPSKSALIDDIFRIIHSIKGTCGFFGLNKLAELSHATEEILSKIRAKQLRVNEQAITVILDAIEAIKSIVIYIGKNATEPQIDYSELIQRIVNLTQNNQPQEASIQVMPVSDPSIQVMPASDPSIIIENEPSKTIRVNVATLEKLMQSVTELVLNRNELLELDQEGEFDHISSALYKLNSITKLMQDAVMETRLQSVSHAWSSIPRMVHDLALTLNKKIKLVMRGESTRLDKQLIESIKDPIVHMVRNAADHGIETPSERLAKGKPAEGTITLEAFHCSGYVVIEVTDDGLGMNIAKIKEKILEKKLASKTQVKSFTDEQAINYIFSPGFSTSDEVTNISGRGVGMDVVKSNIEAMHGSVTLKSEEGKGSCIIITIPLTLAIMQALIIESAGIKFAIPQMNVARVISVKTNTAFKISKVSGQYSLKIDNKMMPCLALSKRLKLASDKEGELVVICTVQGQNYGLIVEEVHDIELIVLKPLSQIAKKTGVYNGNTILGSGEVIMVLSPGRITEKYTSPGEIELAMPKLMQQESVKFLLFENGKDIKALPVELVVTIKEVSVDKIQQSEHGLFLQDKNNMILLVALTKSSKLPLTGSQSIIIIENKSGQVGLLVDKIIDIAPGTLIPNSLLVKINEKLIEMVNINQIEGLLQ